MFGAPEVQPGHDEPAVGAVAQLGAVTGIDVRFGAREVRLEGSRLYGPFEQRVTVRDDQMTLVSPKPTVVRGLIILRPRAGAEGLTVYMVSGGQRRRVPRLPLAIEVQPDQTYQIIVVRDGRDTMQAEVGFVDGVAEKTVEIDAVSPGAQAR